MTPYALEQALRQATERVEADTSDRVVLTELFILVRKLIQHEADKEADRRVRMPSEDGY
jgi:hypothetical protein